MNRRIALGTLFVTLLAWSAAAAALPQASKPSSAPATVVNINSATAEQLDALPGVGAKLAARIIEYRQKNGGFKKLEDLMNVQGIGEKNFLKLKPLITLGPARSTAPSPQEPR